MLPGKGAYLDEITSGMQIRSVPVGRELDGSSPPSLFIGRWNYPNVLAGPMVTPVHGDTGIMDAPEAWIPRQLSQDEIIGYRLNLVRGVHPVRAGDMQDPIIEKLQELALSATSLKSDIRFRNAPRGMSFSDEHTPFGPSGQLERFSCEPGRWNHDLERVYYDTDLDAGDAVMQLHAGGVAFSSIQKAFSAGVMGVEKRRHLVPTRWSITACDSTIGDRLLRDVRRNPQLDTIRVHEFNSLHNHYAVLLLPTAWQYEWMEAFLRILGNEEMLFADHEGFRGKKEYSPVGGCFYSCRMAVLEALCREGIQAGAIIFREAYRGYVPLGVFNVRENVRNAMAQPAQEFEDLPAALAAIGSRLRLPMTRFIRESSLLQDCCRGGQTTLSHFAGASPPSPA
ncbi:MAG: hypothetical protein GKC04_05875 [Methanomicrobiales archaeon]|nr:hypothetical protein [Methanomicrobiales archaeon]